MTEDELIEDVKHWKAVADSRQEEIDRLRLEIETLRAMCRQPCAYCSHP